MSYVKGRLRSILYALRGLGWLLGTQHNALIHTFVSLAVVTVGFYFEVNRLEWALLVLAMGSVWAAEALNTGIEWVVDLCSPDYHPLAEKAKDVAAAAVLLTSLAASAVGLLVFYPYVFV